jgi:putative membrane protein
MRRLPFVALAATLVLAGCGVSTQDFTQKAAMSDMYEVEAGKIAADKGQSAEVKQFGQQMVDAHSATGAELKTIVTDQKLNVTLPAKLDSDHQAMIDELSKATPADFDKVYVAQQVKGHEAAAKLFKHYAERGDNKPLQDFAAKTLPTIEKHLSMAESLRQAHTS